MYPVNPGNTLEKSVSLCVLFFLAWFCPHLDLSDRYLRQQYAPFYVILNLIYDPALMNGTRLELPVSHLSVWGGAGSLWTGGGDFTRSFLSCCYGSHVKSFLVAVIPTCRVTFQTCCWQIWNLPHPTSRSIPCSYPTRPPTLSPRWDTPSRMCARLLQSRLHLRPML